MEYKVETKFNKSRIEQETKLVDNFSDTVQTISSRVINLEEQGVIDALVALGWTPPVEAPPAVEKMYCCVGAANRKDLNDGRWHSKNCGNWLPF